MKAIRTGIFVAMILAGSLSAAEKKPSLGFAEWLKPEPAEKVAPAVAQKNIIHPAIAEKVMRQRDEKASSPRFHRSLGLFPVQPGGCPCCDNENPLRAKLLKAMRRD